MRTMHTTVYVMNASKPHTRIYSSEDTILNPTIEAGTIDLTYHEADEHYQADDATRTAAAITAATRTTGDGWHVAPTRERTTRYIELTDDIAQKMRTTEIKVPSGYTLLQRDLNGGTQYALVRCQLMPHMPNTPKRTRVL